MIQTNAAFTFPPLPTQIVLGFGVLLQLPEKVSELGGGKVLLVTDKGIVKSGIAGRIQEILESAGKGVVLYDEVPQDSSSGVIERGAARLNESGCSVVVGVGGGSSLDTAKAIAIMATNAPPITQYAGLNKVKNPPLPVIAIPTAAGTGSEVTYWAVLTNDADRVKTSVGGQAVFPKVALCDPELTVGLPPFLTATTGMDALTHAIESYVNTSYQPISSVLTLEAIRLIGRYLERAVANGNDREARYGMLLGSVMAAVGMNPTRLGIVHALAMPLGSWELKIPHGTGNAVLLPRVMEYNVSAAPEIYAEVARALGIRTDGMKTVDAAQAAVDRVKEIVAKIGIPKGLGALGLTKERIPAVCEEAMKSGNIPVNPRQVGLKELAELCERAL